MKLRLLASGVWTVYAVADGRHDVLESMAELRSQRRSDVDGLIRLLEDVAAGTRDPTRLPVEVSHRVDDANQIWQFTRGSIRILWFYSGVRVMVCGHTFVKKSKKTPRSAIDIAISLRRRFEDSVKIGALEVIDNENG